MSQLLGVRRSLQEHGIWQLAALEITSEPLDVQLAQWGATNMYSTAFDLVYHTPLPATTNSPWDLALHSNLRERLGGPAGPLCRLFRSLFPPNVGTIVQEYVYPRTPPTVTLEIRNADLLPALQRDNVFYLLPCFDTPALFSLLEQVMKGKDPAQRPFYDRCMAAIVGK